VGRLCPKAGALSNRWCLGRHLLHTQTATFLRLALLFIPGVIVADVPYQVD
jgi:hypothetical protein